MNHDKIRFSIITPAYNVEKYVNNCMDSLATQTYKFTYEHIIIDDGSTDQTLKICNERSKKDPHLKVIHQVNGGAGTARNTGIKAASGEWIVFLDADDVLASNALETLDRISELHSEICIIIFRYKILSDRTIKKYIGHSSEKDLQDEEVYFSPEKAWSLFFHSPFIGGAVGNKAIKRKFVIDNELYFPLFRAREDAYWFRKIMMTGVWGIYTSDILYYQCARYGSTEQSIFGLSFMEYLSINSETCTYIENHYPMLVEDALILSIKTKIDILKRIRADGLYKKYSMEYDDLVSNTTDDINKLRRFEPNSEYITMFKKIIDNSYEWKKECVIYGIKRRKLRVKRYIYAKIFT